MIYIRAGLFAEGRTDYEFLLPLLDRLLDAIAASSYPGRHEVARSMGIDAPRGFEGRRAEGVAAAIHAAWDECTLFVIHADGAGKPEEARRSRIEPGIAAARAARADRFVVAAPCVPVREIEAWMLCDPEVFRTLCGGEARIPCPAEPERELDPKETLYRRLRQGGLRRAPERLYTLFGERVRLDMLDALPSFRVFRAELTGALRELAHGAGTEER